MSAASHKFTVQSFPRHSTVLITTDGDCTLICLRCAKTRRMIASTTSPFTLHYPEPEYCTCDMPQQHINVDACLADVESMRESLLHVHDYLRVQGHTKEASKELEQTCDAAMRVWDILTHLVSNLRGEE
ncbi:MAG: hypothetical protein ABI324_24850 [Ktedonobacteraceae bacterium]